MKHSAMKTWGSEGIAPPFLTLELDGRESLASRPGRFAARKEPPGTHLIGDWNMKMDLREIGWGGTDWINLAED
jgi:hypothetical protein